MLSYNIIVSNYHLITRETNLPDKTAPVGALVQPGKQSTHAAHRQSIIEQSRHRAAGELVIPDMTKAFYKESYVDKIKKVRTSLINVPTMLYCN